jgi:hypothetical protein
MRPGTETPANLRLKGIVVCDGLLRLCRLATDVFGNDLDRFVVYLAVISASTGHFQRDPELRALFRRTGAARRPAPGDQPPRHRRLGGPAQGDGPSQDRGADR